MVSRHSSARNDAFSLLQVCRSPMHSTDTTAFGGALISIKGKSPISLIKQGSTEDSILLEPRIVRGNPILIATGIDRQGKILTVSFGLVVCKVRNDALAFKRSLLCAFPKVGIEGF